MSITEKQAEIHRLHEQGMSIRAIARAQGKDYKTINRQLKAAKRWLALDPYIAQGLKDHGVENLDGVSGGWLIKKDGEGGRLSLMFRTEDGQQQSIADKLKEAFADIPTAPTTPAPENCAADLLTLYPIADLHAGMMAWGEETGEDSNTKATTQRLFSWMAQCVDAAPESDTAVVLLNGDTFHSDDQTNQTPRSRHVLDADTRQFKTLDVTITAIAGAIEYAARKHARVIVVALPGNHDPHAYMTALFALDQRYRDHDRIEVRKKPGEWWVHHFGKVMLASHHGDKAKAPQMVHFLADDYAPIWGRTRYRYLWTGHLHHHKSQDIGGVQWEQLRAVTARDAYAVSHAYSARAQMQAITYHRDRGEIQRFKVGL